MDRKIYKERQGNYAGMKCIIKYAKFAGSSNLRMIKNAWGIRETQHFKDFQKILGLLMIAYGTPSPAMEEAPGQWQCVHRAFCSQPTIGSPEFRDRRIGQCTRTYKTTPCRYMQEASPSSPQHILSVGDKKTVSMNWHQVGPSYLPPRSRRGHHPTLSM